MLEDAGYNSALLKAGSISGHRECFSGASLSVCKNGSVIAIHEIVNEGLSNCLVNLLLRNLVVENSFKLELVRGFEIANCVVLGLLGAAKFEDFSYFLFLIATSCAANIILYNRLQHQFLMINRFETRIGLNL